MEKLIRNFVYSFTELEPYILELESGAELLFLKRHLKSDLIQIFIPEIAYNELTTSEINQTIKDAQNILKDSNSHLLSIYGIRIEDIKCFSKGMYIESFIRSICDSNIWKPKSSVRRKINKSLATFAYSCTLSKDDLVKGLSLSSYADYAYDNDINEIFKHSEFYDTQDSTVSVVCKNGKEIIGLMVGVIHNEVGYMIEHYYNSNYTKKYINYGLYFNFINECKYRGIRIIDFGNTHNSDYGLIYFKSQFSTSYKEGYMINLQIIK